MYPSVRESTAVTRTTPSFVTVTTASDGTALSGSSGLSGGSGLSGSSSDEHVRDRARPRPVSLPSPFSLPGEHRKRQRVQHTQRAGVYQCVCLQLYGCTPAPAPAPMRLCARVCVCVRVCVCLREVTAGKAGTSFYRVTTRRRSSSSALRNPRQTEFLQQWRERFNALQAQHD